MQTASSLSSTALATPPPLPRSAAAPTANVATSSASPALEPSVSVTLGDPAAAASDPTYTSRGSLAVSLPAWEQNTNDAITTAMAANYKTGSLNDRFHGLGAALLGRFQGSGGDYSQSVILGATAPVGAEQATDVDRVRQSQLHTLADNQVTLDIQTASGATVHLSLTNQGSGLGVQIEVSNGTLSDTERVALAGLADGFQDAIDGLTGVPPRLALDGLTQFDTSVLSSVKMQASFKLPDGTLQSFSFHADGQGRGVSFTGATGTVAIDVDLSNRALIGSPEQQSRALASYLAQFDQAGSRGKANTSQMDMFKDAFTALNTNYGNSAPWSVAPARPVIALDDTDHAMLTGLADFSASISDAPQFTNPMRAQEVDGFSYQASQHTRVGGARTEDRAIQQTQQSHLTASYHQALYPDTPLDLTKDPKSQNYYYTRIDDSARSVTNIGYEDGVLTTASISQSVNQSMRVQKYVMGDLQQDIDTPSAVSRSWTLADLLNSAKPNERSASPQDIAQWRNTLSTLGDMVIMKANVAQLRAERSVP
jgi:hypothetical protein